MLTATFCQVILMAPTFCWLETPYLTLRMSVYREKVLIMDWKYNEYYGPDVFPHRIFLLD